MSEAKQSAPWAQPMPEEQFQRMRNIIAAPSPVGLEGAMTHGVLEPIFREFMLPSWAIRRFGGNAGIVCDTHPGRDDMLSMMLIGHADKIRLQVRSIGDDGKIWVQSDSFLPGTLIGHEVRLFSEDPANRGHYRVLDGATIEAVGAIHFAKPEMRKGDAGIKAEMLYLELQIYGDDKKAQVEGLGIRPGDPILLKRPIRRGFSHNTFYGAYLDNGLGCFITSEIARNIAAVGGLKNLRMLFAIASHEEIGRMGSRVLANAFKPDILFAVDVSHDYEAAPGVSDRRFEPIAMGKGFSMSYGSITSATVNSIMQTVAEENEIPIQRRVAGRDTGTDAMAAAFASIDTAAASIGVPIRNMHTISETGHTGDVIAAVHGLTAFATAVDGENGGRGLTKADLCDRHPRLDRVERIEPVVLDVEDAE